MPNKYFLAAFILMAIAIVTGAYFKGSHDKDSEWKLVIAEQAKQARLKEQDLQQKADDNAKQAIKKQADIQSKLNIALNSLRDRPDRLPETARAGCKGATGAELSEDDSRFLVIEAARADRIREALAECYAHIDMK
jgi:hypothetical protein